MRFLYTTDLHGNEKKYEDVLSFALTNKIKLIHLGADILPKGSELLKAQKKFINGFLKNFYKRCYDNDITVLAFFGNDDLYTRKKYIEKYASLLDETPYENNGYFFEAYPYVPDYPFGLKTACKLDYIGWDRPPQNSIPVEATEKGLEIIKDLNKYFHKKGTIDEDLEELRTGQKVITAIHAPPIGLGLDVCADGRRVGSRSVLSWIKKAQPLIVLSGHIHESYECSGIWRAKVGNTLIIQPGQSVGLTHMVYIEINKGKVASYFISK